MSDTMTIGDRDIPVLTLAELAARGGGWTLRSVDEEWYWLWVDADETVQSNQTQKKERGNEYQTDSQAHDS